MAGSKVRTHRLMWFLGGAVSMAMVLMGPHAIARSAYDAGERVSAWVASL
jgi:hypothetical protein